MIEKEAKGARPFYRPGDVITNSYGGKGVIVDAISIVDGMGYKWNESREPSAIVHAHRPGYAVDWITEDRVEGWDSKQWKNAWWEAHEWSDVQLGLLHDKQVEGEPK